MAQNIKVQKEPFEAVIRALLNTPPMPMAEIPRKREPKRKRERTSKKR